MDIPENEGLHNELKRLQDENFHLKRQLKNRNKEVKNKVKSIKKLKQLLRQFEGEKQHYKNGKRGTHKNGG